MADWSIKNELANLQNMDLSFGLEAPDLRDYKLADYAHQLIMEEIKAFEETLDYDHEIGIKLASFGRSITMSVDEIGYANPSTLFFYGYVDGQKATLIQHVNQLNFLLVAARKTDPDAPPRRIGFALSAGDQEE